MADVVAFDNSTLDRMVLAVEKVRQRLKRAAAALESAGVPYALVGGNAVAAWVAQVDVAAVRNTRDVDILLNRRDFAAAKTALESAGFTHRHVKSIDLFLDGEQLTAGERARARDAVHIVYAGERVRPDYPEVAALMTETESATSAELGAFQVVTLEALVRMKLTSNRDKDRTHVRDLIEVGLIDETWPRRFQAELASRLQSLLDDPDG